MGKALMVVSTTNVIGVQYGNFFGVDGWTNTEAQTQATAPEGFTLSNVAGYIRTLPGTATLRSRVNGANGNGLCSWSATGLQRDTSNTDAYSAGDEFNFSHTGTVAAPTYSWMAANVELDSGHGNFHGAANFAGTSFTANSATRYCPLSSSTISVGTTETEYQWKNRGYTSIEGFQIYVATNARTSDTVVRTRVNGANGGLSVTIAAGATGLMQATGTADTLADGDLINMAFEMGTGSSESLNVRFVLALLKSSSTESETFCNALGSLRSASATEHFLTIGGRATTFVSTPVTDAEARIAPGFAATVRRPRFYLTANTYSADGTFTVYKNGSAAATVPITASGGAGWYENTSDTFTITSTDELSFGVVGGTSGSIAFWQAGLTFAPLSGDVTNNPVYTGQWFAFS